jgi:putative transcriptional regulator
LGDPNFRETVVLLTRYNASGAMGLIVNRPTKLSVKRFLPAADSSQGVYFGGPVELGGLFVLQDKESKESTQVLAGVFLVSDPDAVRKAVSSSSKGVRLFAGYAGWGPGQLDGEMTLGSWHVFPGDAKLVFHPEPETVWQRLVRRTELMIASVRLLGRSDR